MIRKSWPDITLRNEGHTGYMYMYYLIKLMYLFVYSNIELIVYACINLRTFLIRDIIIFVYLNVQATWPSSASNNSQPFLLSQRLNYPYLKLETKICRYKRKKTPLFHQPREPTQSHSFSFSHSQSHTTKRKQKQKQTRKNTAKYV